MALDPKSSCSIINEINTKQYTSWQMSVKIYLNETILRFKDILKEYILLTTNWINLNIDNFNEKGKEKWRELLHAFIDSIFVNKGRWLTVKYY
jgi:hypothetical protein